MNLLTYNIAFGAGLDNLKGCIHSPATLTANFNQILATIQDSHADIVALQEIDRHSKRSGFIDQVEAVRQLGFQHHAFVTTWKKAWVPYPFTWRITQHFGKIWAGQALFSKWPLTPIGTLVFQKPRRLFFPYNWFYLDRVAQMIALHLPHRSTPFYLVHLHLEAFDPRTRQAQIKRLVEWLKMMPKPDVILGDFNAEQEALKPLLDATDLEDSLTLAQVPETQKATFPCDQPKECLDHILVSRRYKQGIKSEVLITPSPYGSDHFPILATLKEPI